MRPPIVSKQTKWRFDQAIRAFDLTSGPISSHADSILLADSFRHLRKVDESFEDAMDIDSAEALILKCIKTLSSSHTGEALLQSALKDGWSLEFQDLDQSDFHLDITEKQIILNNYSLGCASILRSTYFSNATLISFIRALRDVWQEKRHGGFESWLSPENLICLERLRAADCDIVTTLVAWELHTERHSQLWRHLIGSEEGDIALAFHQALERQAQKNDIPFALRTAFRQWFASQDRLAVCDHETLEYLDLLLDEGDLDALCVQPVSSLVIHEISCLPNGNAYLGFEAQDVLSDPLFTEINDPINRSHLLQIIHDVNCITVAGVSFGDADLAQKIFPAGPQQFERVHA